MTDATGTIVDFLGAWGPTKADLHAAFRRYLAPGAVWENVGLVSTTGPEEAIALLERFEQSAGIHAFDVETLHIASHGDVVLTERVDRRIDTEGRIHEPGIRAMGAFEVRGGQIVAWRDYFDTAPFKGG